MDQNPIAGQENKENAPDQPGGAQKGSASTVAQGNVINPVLPVVGPDPSTTAVLSGGTVSDKTIQEKPQTDGFKKDAKGDTPKTGGETPEDAGEKLKNAGINPRDPGTKPQGGGVKSQDAGVKPKETGEKPKDGGEKPKEPADTKPEPMDVQKGGRGPGDKPPVGEQKPVVDDKGRKPDEENTENEDKENTDRIGCKPGDQWPSGVVVNAVRPNQGLLDDEIYSMKCFTPETIKTAVAENPSGHVIDPSGRVVPSGNVINVVAGKDKFIKVNKKQVEENGEDEEEEEDEEVEIPSLKNKGRLQILRKDDEAGDLEPLKQLNPKQQEIYTDTTPFLHGFLTGYETITTRKQNGPATTLKPQTISSATQAGQRFSEVCAELGGQYQPLVNSLVDDFSQEIRKISGDSQPSLQTILTSFKKIAVEIFRDGFTWSRVMTLFSFTFDVFTRLYNEHAAQIAQYFVNRVSNIFANIGLVAWVAEKGGWKMAADGVSEENPRRASFAKPQMQKNGAAKPCGECMFARWVSTPARILGAAGAVAAAGAAYFLFRR